MFKFRIYLISLFVTLNFSLNYVNAIEENILAQHEISDEVFNKRKVFYSDIRSKFMMIEEELNKSKAIIGVYKERKPHLSIRFDSILQRLENFKNSIPNPLPQPLKQLTKGDLTIEFLKEYSNYFKQISAQYSSFSLESLDAYDSSAGRIATATIEETNKIIEQKATKSTFEAELIEKVVDHYANLSINH